MKDLKVYPNSNSDDREKRTGTAGIVLQVQHV